MQIDHQLVDAFIVSAVVIAGSAWNEHRFNALFRRIDGCSEHRFNALFRRIDGYDDSLNAKVNKIEVEMTAARKRFGLYP